MNAKARGGMRLGELYGSWPSAKIEITPTEILIDFFGEYVVQKEDVEKLIFLHGSFTGDIHIHHDCDWSDEPIRFFGFGSLDHVEKFAVECGYPCEVRKKKFYEKGDVTWLE